LIVAGAGQKDAGSGSSSSSSGVGAPTAVATSAAGKLGMGSDLGCVLAALYMGFGLVFGL
jgi:hypothetical protein